MAPSSTARSAVLGLVLVTVLTASTAIPNNPLVTDGKTSFVFGTKMTSAGMFAPARDYAAFWGVPFAKPPVGERRFKMPERVSMPNGSFAASNMDAPPCLQFNPPVGLLGSEDCLTLQIFTPNYDTPTLDVLVFIHGGGFMFGKGPRSGVQFLMDMDMVVVNVDYRLGVLGYLSFDDEEQPGNIGMLDQVEALHWVQENIGHFGGNNKSVTLVGFSAGSASALLHTMSPLSKGLFHKVIALSGSPINPWAQQPSARANALRLATLANCNASTTAATLECLRKWNATELVALEKHYQDWHNNPFSPFAPVVDRKSKKPFLPDYPTHLLRNKKNLADVPIIMSACTEEGLFTAAEFILKPDVVRELDENWGEIAPKLLHFHDDRVAGEEKVSVANKIREHYLKNASIANSTKELVRLMTDRNFAAGIGDIALSIAAVQSSPVYFYQFAYRGQYSLSEYESGGDKTNLGVSHADDYQYYFEMAGWSGTMAAEADIAMRRHLINVWSSFMNKSVPTIEGVTWKPLPKTGGDVLHFLNISSPTNMSMSQQKDYGQSAFWKSLNINEDGNHSGRITASLSLSLAPLLLLAHKMFASSL